MARLVMERERLPGGFGAIFNGVALDVYVISNFFLNLTSEEIPAATKLINLIWS